MLLDRIANGKRVMKELINRRIYVHVDDNSVNTIRIASQYMDNGMIALDGLVKNMKDERLIIYSAGIGDQIHFELELLKILKTGGKAELYAFDPTPKSLEFLSNQELPENFHVFPYAISEKNETLQFALPTKDGWVSGSAENVKQDSRELDFINTIEVQGKSLESIMEELGHDRIDLLKMDIEGSEFNALPPALEKRLDIKQMTIDHHEHMFRNGNKKLRSLVKELHKAGYKIFYATKKGEGGRNFSAILQIK